MTNPEHFPQIVAPNARVALPVLFFLASLCPKTLFIATILQVPNTYKMVILIKI